MKKVVRFSELTTVIQLEDGETQNDVEEKLVKALDSIGARFVAYRAETKEKDQVTEAEPV